MLETVLTHNLTHQRFLQGSFKSTWMWMFLSNKTFYLFRNAESPFGGVNQSLVPSPSPPSPPSPTVWREHLQMWGCQACFSCDPKRICHLRCVRDDLPYWLEEVPEKCEHLFLNKFKGSGALTIYGSQYSKESIQWEIQTENLVLIFVPAILQ